jgi:hypothetical protein
MFATAVVRSDAQLLESPERVVAVAAFPLIAIAQVPDAFPPVNVGEYEL